MTDKPQTPVVANSNVAQVQAEALVRQVCSALGLIVAAFGLAKWAGVLGVIGNLAGPIVTCGGALFGLGALIWGQIHTRSQQKKFIVAADAAPSEIAQVK